MSEEQKETAMDDVALFLNQVDEMRKAQKKYFECSHSSQKAALLSKSKHHERIVDKRLGRTKALVSNLKTLNQND